jgi:hypothetical protein
VPPLFAQSVELTSEHPPSVVQHEPVEDEWMFTVKSQTVPMSVSAPVPAGSPQEEYGLVEATRTRIRVEPRVAFAGTKTVPVKVCVGAASQMRSNCSPCAAVPKRKFWSQSIQTDDCTPVNVDGLVTVIEYACPWNRSVETEVKSE